MSGKPFSSLPLHTPKKRNIARRCSSFFGGYSCTKMTNIVKKEILPQ